ncbi:MAG: RtcB family protein [Deltaproteobacteria bacterium]|nr:RtcB family protein [Deltaproteobacteria bacterium]
MDPHVHPPELHPVGEALYELPRSARADMRVPVRVVADAVLMLQLSHDHSLEQLINVSTLPGIVGFALGMPDMHEGYGFPVGGVAATRWPDGVISPGGIGFDINCGVRLLASTISADALGARLEPLVHELSRSVPTGYGRSGRLELSSDQLDHVLIEGCNYLVNQLGFGEPEDLEHIEANGRLAAADVAQVSLHARERGADQLGTLGGGNHFLEVQRVQSVLDDEAARAFGIFEGQLVVLIHTGSRGLGHQVCSDHVRTMDAVHARYGITLPDRQLACAPLSSPEGRGYFAAMCAAANFAFCNRQVLTQRARECFLRVLGRHEGTLRVVYDVAHNMAKLERHGDELLCVHRKGATRAFGPSRDEVPARYRHVGQPVFIPGSMGTASYVLAGADTSEAISLASCCHGAGRAMSRTSAKHQVQGHLLRRELEARGIVVRCPSNAELAEEAPLAYKDVDRVVDVVARAGLARKVARLVPLGVLKG